MTNEQLGPSLAMDAPPAAWLQCAEKRELLRIAAQSALNRSRGGKDLLPDARRWAEHWAGQKPLTRPLGSGEPGEIK